MLANCHIYNVLRIDVKLDEKKFITAERNSVADECRKTVLSDDENESVIFEIFVNEY